MEKVVLIPEFQRHEPAAHARLATRPCTGRAHGLRQLRKLAAHRQSSGGASNRRWGLGSLACGAAAATATARACCTSRVKVRAVASSHASTTAECHSGKGGVAKSGRCTRLARRSSEHESSCKSTATSSTSRRAGAETDVETGGLQRRDAMLCGTGIASSASLLWRSPPAAAEVAAPPRSPSIATVPTVKVGSTLEFSRTIQGYWQLAGGHGPVDPQVAVKNMERHYAAGITTLDTADIYGQSEVIVGTFMREQRNAVPCTKFCCFRGLESIDKKDVRRKVEAQLQRLNVSALPLTAFFWSNYDVPRYVEVAQMLTDLKKEGLIKELGATNFDTIRLKEMVDAGIPLVSNQVQLSLLDRRPLASGMADYCEKNGIKLIAFGTVGGGLLSERYLGKPPLQTWELDTVSLRMYNTSAVRSLGTWALLQELLGTLKDIGDKYGVTIANVAQRWVLDSSPAVASVLIGVRNSNHVEENVKTHSFKLDASDMQAIAQVLDKGRAPVGDVWGLERGLVRM